MKYCPSCVAEYRDEIVTCADCGVPLISEAELASRPGLRRLEHDQTTAFARVATADDPFEADAFTAAVDAAGIQVLSRMRRNSAVDAITTGVSHPWWEILVPEKDLERARQVIDQRRAELEAAEPEAEAAAEEEERQTEEATAPKL